MDLGLSKTGVKRRLITFSFRVVSQGLAFFIGQQVFISAMLFEQCEYTTFFQKKS